MQTYIIPYTIRDGDNEYNVTSRTQFDHEPTQAETEKRVLENYFYEKEDAKILGFAKLQLKESGYFEIENGQRIIEDIGLAYRHYEPEEVDELVWSARNIFTFLETEPSYKFKQEIATKLPIAALEKAIYVLRPEWLPERVKW